MKNHPEPNSLDPEEPTVFIAPSGLHDYDLVVGLLTRVHPAAVVGQLARLYPLDFDAVAKALPAHALQVLLPATDYRLSLLADPQFDPREELTDLLEDTAAIERIECHPIAGALCLRKEVDLIAEQIGELDIDAAKALWAALVFAQTGIDDYHRIVAHWWTAEFILSASSTTKHTARLPLRSFSNS